jgi:hypothetical protein
MLVLSYGALTEYVSFGINCCLSGLNCEATVISHDRRSSSIRLSLTNHCCRLGWQRLGQFYIISSVCGTIFEYHDRTLLVTDQCHVKSWKLWLVSFDNGMNGRNCLSSY